MNVGIQREADSSPVGLSRPSAGDQTFGCDSSSSHRALSSRACERRWEHTVRTEGVARHYLGRLRGEDRPCVGGSRLGQTAEPVRWAERHSWVDTADAVDDRPEASALGQALADCWDERKG